MIKSDEYRCFRAYKIEIICHLIDYMRNNELTKQEKETFYNIVINLRSATENQINCFCRRFGLKPPQFKSETSKIIAKDTNRSDSAINSAIIGIRTKLTNISLDKFYELDKIYKTHQKDEYLKIYKEYKKSVDKHMKTKCD